MANPTLLSRLLCADADKNTIPDTDAGTAGVFSQQYGWQAINSLPLSAGGKAVQRQDFNGVFNLLGGIAFYAQKGYTFEWDIDQDYYAGCVVTDPLDGNKYNAKNDVAKGGSNPSLDSTNWELANIDTSTFADTNLSNLTATGEDHYLNKDFTIIYPNGGTAENPANITYNTRYVETNPFTGYYVACIIEGYYNGTWHILTYSTSTASYYYGAVCKQNGENLIIQTMNSGIVSDGNSSYNGNDEKPSSTINTLPCRVKVWKVGKIPT